jgi:putative PIN family toxin of toxin-antitoxin system
MKIVLDSNVLLVAISKKSKYRPIWDAFLAGKVQMIVSDDVVYEYEEILQRYLTKAVADIIMEILVESVDVSFQQIYYSWNIIKKDPDDNKFFDIAIAANVNYLVTNDAHFDIAKKITFPNVTIVSAEEFLLILQNL